MKILFIVSLCIFSLVGCGKAEITTGCTLNGQGDATCTFKNSGKAKGSTCQHIALLPKDGVRVNFFLGVEDAKGLIEAFRQELKKSKPIFKVEGDLPDGAITINSKNMIYSTRAVCSGIVEAGDVRQVAAFFKFFLDKSPAEICSNSIGGWADGCEFIMVPKEEVISLVQAKLNE